MPWHRIKKAPLLSRREFLQMTAAAATAAMLPPRESGADEPSLLAIKGDWLIDGTGLDAVPDGVVVISGNRIQAAGPADQIKIPDGADIREVAGGTILPGVINAHVHLGFRRETLRDWLRGGVTMIRDMGGMMADTAELFRIRDALAQVPGTARLTAVGSFVNTPGGYPIAFWGGYAVPIDSPRTAKDVVARLVDLGADAIKTALESGYAFNQSGWPLLSPDIAKAIVAAAHERGKEVTAHVTHSLDLPAALAAGCNEIAHMVVDNLPEDLVARAVAQGIRWVPTLELWQGVSRKHSLPFVENSLENLARFASAGGEISLGTDYGGTPPDIHFDLGMPMTEIRLMQQAGMVPMDIITAATRNAARSCGMAAVTGTLTAGKLADILVVKGNPLTDIEALGKSCLVIREGQVLT